MHRSSLPLAGLLLLPLFTACEAMLGKEVARLTVDAVSTDEGNVIKETRLDLKQGEKLAVWSHMALEYDEPLDLRFQVQVVRDSVLEQELEVDPFEKNVTTGELRSQVGSHVTWSFTGKNASITIPQDGSYTIRTRLIATPNPSLKLTKAELILKK